MIVAGGEGIIVYKQIYKQAVVYKQLYKQAVVHTCDKLMIVLYKQAVVIQHKLQIVTNDQRA
jgi:regulatory protein YycI of two-component signal transduction system YycFG